MFEEHVVCRLHCLALIFMQQAGNGVIKVVSTSLCLSLFVRVWLGRVDAL